MPNLMISSPMQIPPSNSLRSVSDDSAGLRDYCYFLKNSGKQWKTVAGQRGFAVFWFTERSAAEDFCGNEISMADDSLQKTGKNSQPRHAASDTARWLGASYECVTSNRHCELGPGFARRGRAQPGPNSQ